MSISQKIRKHPVSVLMYVLLGLIVMVLFFDFTRTPALEMDATDPYVLTTKGTTTIERDKVITIKEKEKFSLLVGDTVKTLPESAATVFWPDGSVTRLGEKTTIVINEVDVDTRKAEIRIDFSLESGKTWSNVIRYMFGESYFHQRFNGNHSLAAVRGTVFEVNLDKGYVHTVDHAISLTDQATGTDVTVAEGWAVSTSNFLEQISQKYLDSAWIMLNQTADSEYIKQKTEETKQMLLKVLEEDSMVTQVRSEVRLMLGLADERLLINAIINQDEESKQELLKALKEGNETGSLNRMLLDLYVMVDYFPNEEANMDMKLQLREFILQTATPEQKEYLLNEFAKHTLYDYWSSLQSNSLDQAQKLNSTLQDYIKQGASVDMIQTLQEALGSDIISLMQDIANSGDPLNVLGETGSSLLKHLETVDYAKKIQDRVKNINVDDINAINAKTEEVKKGAMDWVLNKVK